MRYPPFKMHFGVFQRGVILVNEVGMVFIYAIFTVLKILKQRRETVWSIHT
ncbi:hypothetical protein [Paenibacillus polymyxa]|uniref:hypothetical protein n=1 Tax=Paenibacillus polymyxa TaxID=1406 RepID=UPI0001E6C5DE|nr:hypothetical protein [Paenibacillus polymyxa]